MFADDSDTFRLDNLESEAAGGAWQWFDSPQRQETSAKQLDQLWGTFAVLSSRYQGYEVCPECIQPFWISREPVAWPWCNLTASRRRPFLRIREQSLSRGASKSAVRRRWLRSCTVWLYCDNCTVIYYSYNYFKLLLFPVILWWIPTQTRDVCKAGNPTLGNT